MPSWFRGGEQASTLLPHSVPSALGELRCPTQWQDGVLVQSLLRVGNSGWVLKAE